MLCADKACRPDHYTSRLGTRILPVLRTGELWCRLYPSVMAHWYQQRGMGQLFLYFLLEYSNGDYISDASAMQPPPAWTMPGGQQQQQESPNTAMKRRRKSLGADSPEVVCIGQSPLPECLTPLTHTIDQIRPDWEAKLAAVRAAVARRANRRIIMRQVGDRLIPVGISSGRIHALNPEEVTGAEGGEGGNSERGSRRSRRRNQNPDLNQYLGQMGLAGQDLEEVRS